jgi:glycosyltransferase involved in cell wall biosynthesis
MSDDTMKLKILHVVSSLSVNSGVMRVIMNWYRNIDREKIEFHFIYFIDGEFTYCEEILRLGGKYLLTSKPKFIWGQFRKDLSKILHINRFAAIHNHELYMNFIVYPIANKNHLPVITHSHTTKYSDRFFANIRNFVLNLPLNYQSDYKFACSIAAGKHAYGHKNLLNNKITIINNAIELNEFSFRLNTRNEYRKIFNLDAKLVIGNVGRFNNQKNHIFLIEIFSEMINQRKDIHLFLVGEGPLRVKILEQLTKRNISDYVTILSKRDDVSSLMMMFDIFVLPSLYEGLPVVGVEAQTSGLQCYFSTAITPEIGVVNSEFISLNESPVEWANIILNNMNKSIAREDAYVKMQRYGFDIKLEMEKLMKFYLNL